MSEVPAGETITNEVNSASAIKARTAAALIRYIQEMTPTLDKGRLILSELQDVIDIHGALADTDLGNLGVDAATVTSLGAFLTKLVEFMDASTQTRKSYRSAINAVRRINAAI